jgi:acetylornithine/succinyldiaminopimelate/putrescine aminotransferase
MEMTREARDDLFRDYARIVSQAHVNELESLGHDFIEARAQGPYVYDTEGKQYIDCKCASSIFNLGRRHPEILARLRDAMYETDQGNFPMISREKATLAKALADFVPGGLECSVFSVVRGEAFDFACKLARGYSTRKELLAVDGSWFGQTGFALSLSERHDKDDFGPLMPGTRVCSYNDLDAARRSITLQTAAVILELVQAENHCRQADKRYISELQRICRENGALFVVDETQTGMGRTGEKFAFEHYGLQPDIVVIGESIGAGVFPIAATVFTQKVNAFMNEHPLIHLSTFGGADLGCVVACKAVQVYKQTRPWENAASLGKLLKDGIEKIIERQGGVIGSVAGLGLLLSLDLKIETAARAFCKNLAGAGVLASPGAVARQTVVLRPSLTIASKDVDRILEAIEGAARAMG